MGTVENDGCKLIACQLCRVMVASIAEHEGSARHQAARRLAAAALDRLRAQLAPQTSIRDNDITANPITTDPDTDDQVFCGACASNIPASERNHSRCKAHLMDALNEQILDELVRDYVEEEDLTLMEAPSKDPSDVDTGNVVGNREVVEKYKCYLCDVPIPTVFRTEHEHSVRHRANQACAHAAARRISAQLVPTATPILPIEISTVDKITPLLKVFLKLDTKDAPEMIQKDKENAKVAETEVNETAEKRLTAKKYFTEVQQHLGEIGDFCAIIIDDTEYVTVKAGKNTLRVHVADFNGIYNVGNEMKCRMCDHDYFHVSYNSGRQHDRFHVMSLGHIARVLTPIDNVHGIRQIDHIHYFCIICNVFLPSTHAVKSHITMDIQHTALLPEALKRGNAFKESKDDLKIVLYGLARTNIPNHQSSHSSVGFTNTQKTVKPPNLIGSGPTFGGINSQADENSNLFSQSSSSAKEMLAKNNTNPSFGSTLQPTITQSNLNTFSFTPKSNAYPCKNTGTGASIVQTGQIFSGANASPLPKCFGVSATAFGTSHTGGLPNQNTPTQDNGHLRQSVFGAAPQQTNK